MQERPIKFNEGVLEPQKTSNRAFSYAKSDL